MRANGLIICNTVQRYVSVEDISYQTCVLSLFIYRLHEGE